MNDTGTITMVDLKGQYKRLKNEIDTAIAEVLNTTAFVNGPAVHAFAWELAAYNSIKHVVPCGNGTDALQLALMALNLQPGDEVIVPAFTYIATVEVIALLGLTPVFADVDENTFLIAPEEITKRITSRTKAIIPVHLFGQCGDMAAIMAIAEQYQLYVIEDAAQAIGAAYQFQDGKIKKAGTIGHIGTTSFFPSKNLGCFGDGGAVFVEDDALAGKIKMLANHGQERKYHHALVGINSRLDTLQAAVLRVKLKYLDDFTSRRNHSAAFYHAALSGLEGIILPERQPASTHVYHQYTIRCTGVDRDSLQTYLKSAGIPTVVYYPVPAHLQEGYLRYGYKAGDFPVTEKLCSQVLSLPIHTEQDEEQLAYIAQKIVEFVKSEV